jgi:hypothetical protein
VKKLKNDERRREVEVQKEGGNGIKKRMGKGRLKKGVEEERWGRRNVGEEGRVEKAREKGKEKKEKRTNKNRKKKKIKKKIKGEKQKERKK